MFHAAEAPAPLTPSPPATSPAALTPSLPTAGTTKKLFNRYEFQQRISALRAQVRAADDEYYGAAATAPRLYSTDEVRATPALKWLDVNARLDYLNQKRNDQPVTAVRFPSLPVTPHRPRQVAQWQSRVLEPLVDEDGAAVQCPICLRELSAHTPLLPATSAAVRWTDCCGRAFHSHCFQKLSRCPMCRTWPLREAASLQTGCAALATAGAAGTAVSLSPGGSTTLREIALPERVDGVRTGWKRPNFSM